MALVVTACTLAVPAAALLSEPAAAAQRRVVKGAVTSGIHVLSKRSVVVYAAGGSDSGPVRLGAGVSDRRGRFRFAYREPSGSGRVLYLTAGRGSGVELAATLGAPPAPRTVVVDELTTVATGYALAQFTAGGRIGGPKPGPQNAALMARNLANPSTGTVASVLRRKPNGNETTTLKTFRSLANMLSGCARSARGCPTLYRLTTTPDGQRPGGSLQAVANIARYPYNNVDALFALARAKPAPYVPALSSRKNPAHWVLPVRFDGDGKSLDGPGNFAIDGDGNLYVANNYEYGSNALVPKCGSNLLPKFTPDGRYAPNSPFQGGGLSGAGYGITLDVKGNVWVGNFGFAAPPPGCPESRQPPHNTVSAFTPEGKALAPDGFDGRPKGSGPDVPSLINWPQGTVADKRGNIWVANCGDGNVVRMRSDDPYSAVALDVGLSEAFDVAVDHNGLVYATGLGNSKLAILNPDGTPRPGSPLSATDAGLDRPMGIAADSRGNMWIANSGFINLPCPSAAFQPRNEASLALVRQGGQPVTRGKRGFTGGGLSVAWGIAVDGNDNIWVSNFFDQRISHFCGVPRKNCPPGAKTGDPISPNGTGYDFDGLTRSTAVQIDPSGNVWATNNWKRIPVQTNPGGYEIVALVGAAAPLKTPLIGPPVPLLP